MGDRPDRRRRRRTGVPLVTTVGFVGLGNIGKPMALRLRAWPASTSPSTTSRPSRWPSSRRPARRSPAASPSWPSAVDLRLRDGARRRPGARGARRAAAARRAEGLVVAIHSTVAPDDSRPTWPTPPAATACTSSTRRSAAGAMGAADGTLAIMVGGSDEAFAACAGPFALMGSKVVHAGPVGAGHARSSWPATCCTSSRSPPPPRRSGWPRRPVSTWSRWARWSGTPTRSPAGRARSCTATRRRRLDPDDFWYGVFDHVRRPRREGPALRHRAGRQPRGRRTPGAARPRATRPGARAADDEERDHERRSSTDCPRRGGRPGEDGARSTASSSSDGPGDFFGYTADHLFADIWNRPGLSDRDRRLLLIGMLADPGRRRRARHPGRRGVHATASSTTRRCARSWSSSATTPAGRSVPGSTRSSRRRSPRVARRQGGPVSQVKNPN